MALSLTIGGCVSNVVKPRVEKGIREALPQYIGPAKQYTVRADGSSTDMLNGLIAGLHIEGRDVEIHPNLTVSRLIVDMQEVRFDPGSRAVTSVASTKFEATVSEAMVNRYIEETQGDSDLTVRLDPGKVLVQFVPRVAGVDVLITVAGKPMIVGGDKINFVADAGSIARLPVPAFAVNKVLDRVNPILDMSVMKFPVQLTDLLVKKGSVVIRGTAVFKPANK